MDTEGRERKKLISKLHGIHNYFENCPSCSKEGDLGFSFSMPNLELS